MKYWYLLIVVFSLYVFSCGKKDKHERAMNDTGYDIRKLKEDVLYRGDVNSYNLLSIEYHCYPVKIQNTNIHLTKYFCKKKRDCLVNYETASYLDLN